MSEPMPLALILAAADYDVPCMISIMHDCRERASRIVVMGHVDGTPHCDPSTAGGMPLCDTHTRAAVAACGPYAALLRAANPPDCEACGMPLTLHRVTTLRGQEVS